jgi:hypothetical protein
MGSKKEKNKKKILSAKAGGVMEDKVDPMGIQDGGEGGSRDSRRRMK